MRASGHGRARVRLGALGGLLTLALIAAALLAPLAEADPAAAWSVESFATPTNLKPGSESTTDFALPSVQVRAYNVGAATAEGLEITDQLPAALSVLPEAEPTAIFGTSHTTVAPADCTVAGSAITCRAPEEGLESTVNSGEMVILHIPVAVSPSADGQEVNEVTVSSDGVPPVTSSSTFTYSDDPAPFAFLPGAAGAHASATLEEGAAATQAGAHPFQLSFGFGVPVENEGNSGQLGPSGGGVKNLSTILPKGMVVDPQAVGKKCIESQLEQEFEGIPSCPLESQVGTVALSVGVGGGTGGEVQPLYEMNPPRGNAAVFGFHAVGGGIFFHLIGRVDSAGEYELAAAGNDISDKLPIPQITVTLWGNPSAEAHDSVRGGCAVQGGTCETERNEDAFVSMPGHCDGAGLLTRSSANSWLEPGAFQERRFFVNEAEGDGSPVEGCGRLAFEPSISSQLTTNVGDSSSGLHFLLHQPQNPAASGLATGILKTARVSLPAGVALNPASANGLQACSENQVGYAPSAGRVRFTEAPQTCPDTAKVGSAEVTTPLLDHKLAGSIYIAKPYENPFGSLLAIYLTVEDRQSGVVAKLAGKVEPNPATGQLTTTFDESPELPLEDVSLEFFGGAGGVLTSPLACGSYTTTSTLTPWSTPEGLDASPSDSFQTAVPGSGSGPCPVSEGEAPATLSFEAGTGSPLAAAYSPFSLRIARADGTQHIAAIDTTLPEGLLGKLAGVPYCSESAIALARSREAPEQGRAEQATPSCPAASEVGTVEVTAGAGINPIPVDGHAYLAGPYRGAPLSLVVIVPALAGPFDLGDVVNRVALDVGTYDARIHAVSDPLPTIIDGIPIDVRSIALKLTRSSFTLNPTSCEAKAIEGAVTTQAGQIAPLKNRFQVGECGALAFKPSLKLSLKGPTKRTGHPALKAVLTMPSGGANIAKAQVGLPHGEFLDNANIGTVCTQPQLKAQSCPPASIYGKAKAWTPLLDKPLEGPVYLGAGFGHKLPDLVADLNGQIRVLVHGKVDTDKRGGIRNTFEAVPDAPVSKFVLEMKGGKKKGLLVNSENVCRTEQKAEVSFTGQNGKVATLNPKIANSCKGGKKTKKKKGGGKSAGKRRG